jgi:hypothetical protein
MRSLLAVALVAAAASTASAGPYVGLGIGTAASPGGELSMTSSDGNRSGRLLVGTSFGRFSIEGAGSRFGVFREAADYDGTQIAAAGKYNFPLGDNFEVFGRAGLQRTWLSADKGGSEWIGNGWLLGAGFQYRFLVKTVDASLFVDYQYAAANLVDQSTTTRERGITLGLWTLGATVSL